MFNIIIFNISNVSRISRLYDWIHNTYAYDPTNKYLVSIN